MLAHLVAQPGWTIGEVLILVVIVGACIGVVYVALKEFGLAPPPWVIHIMWIVVIAFCAILAIRLILSF